MINFVVYFWIFIGVLTFFYLFKTTAPFGRHSSAKWGPQIDNKMGWAIMEIVSPLVFSFIYFSFVETTTKLQLILLLLWNVHYINRSLIFPFRIRTKGKKMPMIVMVSAIFFNVINGSINGYFLTKTTLLFPSFFTIGVVLFVVGFLINNMADTQLIQLRKPNETGYKIPFGFLFRFISCPNLVGEIIEWIGFALMAQTLGAISFAVWTFCNLAPRAVAHHRWYKATFPDYPSSRKALIPFVW